MPRNKNTPKKDKSLTVLYPNKDMQPNINAANTIANKIEIGLDTKIIGEITTPIITEYKNSNQAALDGFIENARACAQMDTARPPNAII